MKSPSVKNNRPARSKNKLMKHIKLNLIIVFITFAMAPAVAQDIPDKPSPPRLVNDYVGLLSGGQIDHLERKLVAFSDTNSTQIAILIVDDLKGYDIVDYSQRVGQKWGIGQKKYDNGAIIVLKPKTSSEKGEVNIDVGYGLEPIIPDITANQIIDNEMIPRFRNNDYYGGLEAATDVMISLAAGQFTADQYKKRSNGGGGLFGFLVPIIVIIIVISMINRRRGSYYNTASRSSSLPFWTALWLGSTIGRSHSGSWSNFSSGSGGFGGGGGFGGFGGGSFGGGGASGSW
jgi:uncharacterized protein